MVSMFLDTWFLGMSLEFTECLANKDAIRGLTSFPPKERLKAASTAG